MKIKILFLMAGLSLIFQACEDSLEVANKSQVQSETLFTTQEGVEAVLYSAYLRYHFFYSFHEAVSGCYEYPCDVLYQTSGGMNADFITMSQFAWTSSNCMANGAVWGAKYESIRDCNNIIDNINVFEASDSIRNEFLAEARYLRAVDYIYLIDAYGDVPLRTSEGDDAYLARTSEDEVGSFIVSELESCVSDLPDPGQEVAYGRATKGAAYAFLARYYLNQKDWENCLAAIQKLEDLKYYELFSSYKELFFVENEPDKNTSNKEMIAGAVCTNVTSLGNCISACAMPTGFVSTPEIPEFNAGTLTNWASQFRIYDDFYNTFDANDGRLDLIFSTYYNASGTLVDLSETADNRRTLKFFDNDGYGANHGNDFPLIRYADILLMKAEALNNLNGPTQEAIDLINQVRTRAGLGNILLTSFATTQELNDHILDERGWEFYYEGLRRTDLIRHGKFISSAQERGVDAQSYHVKYPIPQSEMDCNPNMKQNDGY